VWGASAKHSRGQKVGLDHVLEDEDGMYCFNSSEGYMIERHSFRSCAHIEEVEDPSFFIADCP